jgi:acetyl-CoA carboxylase carboxyl transferase subunit alpha
MVAPLEFEKNIRELESKLEELMALSSEGEMNLTSEAKKLQQKFNKQLQGTYSKLRPWEKVLVARHEERPNFAEYVKGLIKDFTPLAGDRAFAEDCAIMGGIGRFEGLSVMVLGHQKGRDTESRLRHNFGMARPEGYRKAKRLMDMADRFGLPIITFVDTPGAYPGIDAEERGQSEAIASCIEKCVSVKVPLISTITGEGGSGGAIALAVGNEVNILEHSVYSVISPEGCASILWRTSDKKDTAAEALKLTAQDLLKLKIVDNIIPEPLGGAHRNRQQTICAVGDVLRRGFERFMPMGQEALLEQRREKFLNMGRKGVA